MNLMVFDRILKTLLYAESKKLGSVVGTQPAVPRTVTCQKHRCNLQYFILEENYRSVLPLMDHITVEMSEKFGPLLKAA